MGAIKRTNTVSSSTAHLFRAFDDKKASSQKPAVVVRNGQKGNGMGNGPRRDHHKVDDRQISDDEFMEASTEL